MNRGLKAVKPTNQKCPVRALNAIIELTCWRNPMKKDVVSNKFVGEASPTLHKPKRNI